VVNAVADALAPFRVRVTSLPVTPAEILRLLGEQRQDCAAGFPVD
jgi:hypothetical protein